jgi:hypothetical protein
MLYIRTPRLEKIFIRSARLVTRMVVCSFYWIAQFPPDPFDSPRPRLVRCVSRAPPTTAGADVVVEAGVEVKGRGEAAVDLSRPTVVDNTSSPPSGTVDSDAPE